MTVPPFGPNTSPPAVPRLIRKPDRRRASAPRGNSRRRQWLAYITAVLTPIAITYAVAAFNVPPYVFEHVMVLLVVGIVIPFGLLPAVVAALVSVVFDNLLLREPMWRPTITGYRDLLDLALFAAVAIIISSLVRRAHDARVEAQQAAERERLARETRDRLIATVSHDLTTPLSVLSTTVAVAKRFPTVPETEWPRLVRRLDIACAHATSLVRLLADARALETDNFHLHLQQYDLRALVGPVIEMMEAFSDQHQIVFDAPSPVQVTIDADRMRRVVENLVNNAIKYSPGGGTVRVSIAIEHGWAVLTVSDRGVGISADALPRVFEHSYRAPETASIPGLGLGLTIARQVTVRHGGVIDVDSVAGDGTAVTVRLPLAGPSAEPDAAQATAYVQDLSQSTSR